MEPVDMKKLETAILYLQRIADGKNPVNNIPAQDDAVLNNPNVIRCMYFVKEVLEEVKRNKGCIGTRARGNNKQNFPMEILAEFTYREDKTISKLTAQINEPLDADLYQKLSYRPVLQWLRLNGFLTDEWNGELNKTVTVPTDKGKQIGIRAEKRTGQRGTDYMSVIYGRKAQEYLVQNMQAILSSAES